MHRFGVLLGVVLLAGAALAQAPLSPLLTVAGQAANEFFGASISVAGDANADGSTDFVVGAPGGISLFAFLPGSARIFSGVNGAFLAGITMPVPGPLFAASVAPAGDVDGDGHDDALIGMRPTLQASRMIALVISGANGTVLRRLSSSIPDNYFGWSVGGSLDHDHDGVPDPVVSATSHDFPQTDAGALFVHSGATGSLLKFHLGTGLSEMLGADVRVGPDLTFDGIAEVLVGAPGAGVGGQVRILNFWNSQALVTATGVSSSSRIGTAVDWIGDIDGDGTSDFLTGSAVGFANPGIARVYSGATGGLLHHFADPVGGSHYGRAVAGAGDLDLDGVPDFAIGASASVGFVEVRSGLDGSLLRTLTGIEPNGNFGFALEGGVDVGQDGWPDLLVGSPQSQMFGLANAGAVRAYALGP